MAVCGSAAIRVAALKSDFDQPLRFVWDFSYKLKIQFEDLNAITYSWFWTLSNLPMFSTRFESYVRRFAT
jgi:hypothetical protein